MTLAGIRERARNRKPHRLAERPDTHWLDRCGYVVDVSRIPAIPSFALRQIAEMAGNVRKLDRESFDVLESIRRWRLRVARENDAARLRQVEADNPPEPDAVSIPGRWYQERLVARPAVCTEVSVEDFRRQQREQLGVDVQRGTLRKLGETCEH